MLQYIEILFTKVWDGHQTTFQPVYEMAILCWALLRCILLNFATVNHTLDCKGLWNHPLLSLMLADNLVNIHNSMLDFALVHNH